MYTSVGEVLPMYAGNYHSIVAEPDWAKMLSPKNKTKVEAKH